MKHSTLLSLFIISTLTIFSTAKVIRVSDFDVLTDVPNQNKVPVVRTFGFFGNTIEKEGTSLRQSQYGQRLVPGEDGCEFFPEIVFVQDVSSSYEDDMKNLQRLMPELFQFFHDQFQGNVRFSIVSFVDKAVRPFSYEGDFCAHVNLPLAPVNTEDAVKNAQNVFGKLVVGGGYDYFEGSNEAMFRAAASDSVGWSTETHDPITGRPILRLLVVATDAPAHEPQFYNAKEKLNLPPHDLLSNATHRATLNQKINHRCADTDYPYPEDIRRVFKERGITPIIFSGAPYYYNGSKKLVWKQYKEMLKRYNQSKGPWSDMETGLASHYEWFMKEQVRMDAVVEHIDNTSSNFIEVFRRAMDQVTELTCLPPPTSTEFPPTTTEEQVEPTPATRPPPPPTDAPVSSEGPTVPSDAPVNTEGPTVPIVPSEGPTVPIVPSESPTVPSDAPVNSEGPTVPSDAPVNTEGPTVPIVPSEGPTVPNVPSEGPTVPSVPSEGPTVPVNTEGPTVPIVPSEGPTVPSDAPVNSECSTVPISSTSTTTTTTTTTATTSAAAGGGAGIIIGSAAGGAAVGAAAAGVLLAKKLGLAGFGGSSAVDTSLIQDVDNVEITQDREQFENVTGDLFS